MVWWRLFFFVFYFLFDLVVSRICIQKGMPCTSHSWVNYLIYARQREGILWTVLIEGYVIDVDADTSVFFFGTITGLDIEVEVLISLIKPAFSNLCSSAAIALRFGTSNHRRGYLTGLASRSTLSACSMSSLGTPGMSKGHQAKIS
jgi:hypothetical protein